MFYQSFMKFVCLMFLKRNGSGLRESPLRDYLKIDTVSFYNNFLYFHTQYTIYKHYFNKMI